MHFFSLCFPSMCGILDLSGGEGLKSPSRLGQRDSKRSPFGLAARRCDPLQQRFVAPAS